MVITKMKILAFQEDTKLNLDYKNSHLTMTPAVSQISIFNKFQYLPSIQQGSQEKFP